MKLNEKQQKKIMKDNPTQGFDICSKGNLFNEFLKSNICLSIFSLDSPNSILFNIFSKNVLNKGGKFDFIKSSPFTSISLQGTPSFLVIYCAYLRLPEKNAERIVHSVFISNLCLSTGTLNAFGASLL